jgi:hypothetical protein
LYYGYQIPSSTNSSGYFFAMLIPQGSKYRALNFPGGTYEIFAMCAQSYSLALGAQTGVGTPFTTSGQVNLSLAPYNFGGEHIEHDTEFVYDNMTTAPYWLKLLQSFRLDN